MTHLVSEQRLRELSDLRSTSLGDIGHLKLIADAEHDEHVKQGWVSKEDFNRLRKKINDDCLAEVKQAVIEERQRILAGWPV